jgi:hypothetical protein
MAHRNRGFTYEKWWFSRILQASPGPPGLLNHGCAARKGRSRHAVIVQSWQLVTTWTNRRNMETPFFLQLSDLSDLSDGEWEKKRKPTLSDGTSCGKTHDLRATQSKHAVRCCRGTQLCRCNQVHLNLAMLHRGTRDQFMVPDLWCRAVPISIIINPISIRSALS